MQLLVLRALLQICPSIPKAEETPPALCGMVSVGGPGMPGFGTGLAVTAATVGTAGDLLPSKPSAAWAPVLLGGAVALAPPNRAHAAAAMKASTFAQLSLSWAPYVSVQGTGQDGSWFRSCCKHLIVKLGILFL